MPGPSSSPPDPKSLPPAQRQRRRMVVRHALDLIDEGGYEAVQVREVCARAEVSRATLYRYFASKDHLVAAAFQYWAETFPENVRVDLDGARPPAELLSAALRRGTREFIRHPNFVAALATVNMSPDPHAAECLAHFDTIVDEGLRLPLDGVPPQRQEALLRVINACWWGHLVNWAAGKLGTRRLFSVLDELAEILLGDLTVTGRRDAALTRTAAPG